MLPQGDTFVCTKCKFSKPKKGVKKNIVVDKQHERETVVLEDDNADVLPKTKVGCPKCGNNEAYWVLRQTRSSDEPETRIYTCTKCKHRWRAY